MNTLNPNQQKAVLSPHPNKCILAGAGSGKTKTLVECTKYWNQHGVPASQMVVITYTNGGASELVGRSNLKFHFCGTLHAFLLRLLQRFGFVIGLATPLTVMDDEQRKEMIEEAKKQAGYKGKVCDFEDALALGPYGQNVSRVLKPQNLAALAYYQRIAKAQLVDHDTILHYGLKLLRSLPPDTLPVTHLFVDEYQDTAPIDDSIYDFMPVTHRFRCGDPDQSIYKFRGASVDNIVDLTKRDDVEVLLLEENYRCDETICHAAQQLIEHNENRPPKRTVSTTGETGKIIFAPHVEERDELVWLARTINALPDPSQVAVLVRFNRLVERIAFGLEGFGVDVQKVEADRLPEDWGKALRFLQLLDNPDNNDLAYRWLCAVQGERAAKEAKVKAIRANTSINATNMRFQTNLALAEVPQVLAVNGYTRDSVERIKGAIALLPEDASISELLLSFRNEERAPAEVKGVFVGTIHSAKGREWDNVFLPAFEEGMLPSLSKSASIEEERRLAYVAMTRARHHLYLSCVQNRADLYRPVQNKMQRSRFIDEAMN